LRSRSFRIPHNAKNGKGLQFYHPQELQQVYEQGILPTAEKVPDASKNENCCIFCKDFNAVTEILGHPLNENVTMWSLKKTLEKKWNADSSKFDKKDRGHLAAVYEHFSSNLNQTEMKQQLPHLGNVDPFKIAAREKFPVGVGGLDFQIQKIFEFLDLPVKSVFKNRGALPLQALCTQYYWAKCHEDTFRINGDGKLVGTGLREGVTDPWYHKSITASKLSLLVGESQSRALMNGPKGYPMDDAVSLYEVWNKDVLGLRDRQDEMIITAKKELHNQNLESGLYDVRRNFKRLKYDELHREPKLTGYS
jgi:hypothetical protein